MTKQIDWPALGVFTDDTVLPHLLLLFVAWTIGFLVMFYAFKYFTPILLKTAFPAFEKLTPKAKSEYYSRQVSNVHAAFAVFLSVKGVWYSCEDPTQSIFTSEKCLLTPNWTNLNLVVMSSAFCLYDLYICLFEIGYTLNQGGDFIIHHVVGVAGAVTSIALGRQNVPLSAAAILSEASNFAMNIRWFMLKHGFADHWSFLPVSYWFMACFFFSRVVFMLMVFVRNVEAHYLYDWQDQHPILVGLQVATDLLLGALYLLQLYWFWLIIKVVIKAITGAGSGKEEGTVSTDNKEK